MQNGVKTRSELSPKQEEWFDGIISTLMTHKLQLEKGVARQEVRDTYKAIWGNPLDLAISVKKQSTEEIVKIVMLDFLRNVLDRAPHVSHIAFDLSHDKILAWFNIKTDDIDTEDAIILAAAQVNATHYAQTGISIESIIVEEIDKIPVPDHFQSFDIMRKD
jgi:urate oxidase